jgi:hypothetical protein
MTREDRGASSFDELAVGLSSGTLSRGKALRLMGAALVGGALASIPGIAWAKPNRPAGAPCKHDKQCASGVCREDRFGEGRFCTAPAPICTPSCPEGCGCFSTPDGTTTCISCPLGICRLRGPFTSCEEAACNRDPMAGPLEVCVAGPPGFFSCGPECPTSG